MNKLPVYISDTDFTDYVLPHLSHKPNHNRLKVGYHYVFNTILYVLKSGCSWLTLKPENQLLIWQNIYYHYNNTITTNGPLTEVLKNCFQLPTK